MADLQAQGAGFVPMWESKPIWSSVRKRRRAPRVRAVAGSVPGRRCEGAGPGVAGRFAAAAGSGSVSTTSELRISASRR